MRFALLVLVTALAACASTKGTASPAAQEVLDRVAARHPDLVRLTLHAVPQGKKDCTQVASTVAERRGKKSDPEDLEAMRTGQQVVLEEQGAIDVTVPILVKDGAPTATAGVTLRAGAGTDRGTLVLRARAIAQELANEVRAAGKPLW
jgi:iron complex outermembrane receptor protein